MFEFKKGMRVVKVYYGTAGYREAHAGTVTAVSKGVVKVDDEGGITYNSKTGRELENFFPPSYMEITPLPDMDNE